MKGFVIKCHDDTELERLFIDILGLQKEFKVTKLDEENGEIEIKFKEGTETLYHNMKLLVPKGFYHNISMELMVINNEDEIYIFRNLYIPLVTTDPTDTKLIDMRVRGEMKQHADLNKLIKRMIVAGELK